MTKSNTESAWLEDLLLELVRNFGGRIQRLPSMTPEEARTLILQKLVEAKLTGRLSESSEWASFFEDPSMNAYTPAERLHKRARDLQAELSTLKKELT